MNRTQKGALVSLVGCVLCILTYGYIYHQFFIAHKTPGLDTMWPLIVLYLFFAVSLFLWLRKNQGAGEVKQDERDSLIEKRAGIAAFVSVWVLLAAASVVPRMIVGIDGTIPVWSLSFINIGILFGVMLVYSVAVLVQYGKGGTSNE